MLKRPGMEILQNADDKIIPFLSMNYLAGADSRKRFIERFVDQSNA